MNRIAHTLQAEKRRKYRVRARLTGSTDRPRLSVFVSNKHISAQLIDDENQKTLVAVTTVGSKQSAQTMTEKATWVGSEIGKKAKAKKVTTIVFDRSSKLYHGRVKALADAARAEGLEF